MKIAVPSTSDDGLNSYVSRHFGRAPYYTFVEVEEGRISGVEVVPAPFEEHGPGDIPRFVKEYGGEIVIAYGMGRRAVECFEELGIKVVLGASGKVGEVVEAFLQGRLKAGTEWSGCQRSSGECGGKAPRVGS
jgi:predicted Fe-Mo cluster-binding NifX family protein